MSKLLEKINSDPELAAILNQPDADSAEDELELASALSGNAVIAGREFPAPTAAVIALLDAIHSPFVSDDPDSPIATELDVFRALYLLAKREQAALPVLRMKRRAAMLEKLKEPTDPETAYIHIQAREKLADAEGDFDAAALAHVDQLGIFDLNEAASDLCAYLAMASGFSMLPSDDGNNKKKGAMTSTA